MSIVATAFGAGMRAHWPLDPEITYLNHGTVGSPPRAVLEHQRRLQDEIELQPARFLLRQLADTEGDGSRSRMREAIAVVAAFVGADAADLAFVDNITAGANAVLRSFPLRPGDDVVVTSLGYGGVTRAAAYAARTSGATLREIALPGPGAEPAAFVDAIAAGLTARTRLAVVDHLSASTALVLPIAAIAEMCHARGVLVLADGAHVPGNTALDIAALGVDWYAANLHKWAWAPRSCGFLWAHPDQQHHLKPTVISWGLDNGMAAEFDLAGTRDPSPYLTAPKALELLSEIGLDRIFAYNHQLARWAGQHLAERWGTPFTTPTAMLASMVNVALPARFDGDPATAERVRARLEAAGIEVPIYAGTEGLTTRVSAQIYCDRADVERLGEAVATLR